MKSYPWLFSALLSLAAEFALGSDPILWAVSDGGNGHYYQIVSLSGDWTEANDVADRLGFKGMAGHLVTITSEAEAEFIESSLLPLSEPVSVNYWMGISDQQVEGTFQWVTGESVAFTDWAEGEPNDFGSGEDFAAIRWEVACEDGECVVTTAEWNDLANEGEQGFERLGPFPIVEFEPRAEPLYFAQFGDGDGLVSKIVLTALDPTADSMVTIRLKDDDGGPLSVDLNGEVVAGLLETSIPAGGLVTFQTDGRGPLQAGSVLVESDRPLSGVILFGGSVGLAGVGKSAVLEEGFSAPMEANVATGVDTGVAAVNIEGQEVTLELQLCDSEGGRLTTTEVTLPMMGHLALFVTQFDWNQPVDFSAFEGILKVTSSGRIAATVIQTRPGQFATLPVTPR